MDEWEIIESNIRAAKVTLDDLDAGYEDMEKIAFKSSFLHPHNDFATHVAKSNKKRLKAAKESK